MDAINIQLNVDPDALKKITECRIIYFTFYWKVGLQILVKSKDIYETSGKFQ